MLGPTSWDIRPRTYALEHTCWDIRAGTHGLERGIWPDLDTSTWHVWIQTINNVAVACYDLGLSSVLSQQSVLEPTQVKHVLGPTVYNIRSRTYALEHTPWDPPFLSTEIVYGLSNGSNGDDLEWLSRSFTGSVAGLFKCNPSNIYAAFYTDLTDSVLAVHLR